MGVSTTVTLSVLGQKMKAPTAISPEYSIESKAGTALVVALVLAENYIRQQLAVLNGLHPTDSWVTTENVGHNQTQRPIYH
jgi:hypothetical protein